MIKNLPGDLFLVTSKTGKNLDQRNWHSHRLFEDYATGTMICRATKLFKVSKNKQAKPILSANQYARS